MDFRKVALIALVGLVACGFHATWLWQPERQVRLHTAHFLQAVEAKRWEKMSAFVAADYADRWGHDKDAVLGGSREVFQQFVFLTIESATDSIVLAPPTASSRTRVKMSGSGGPVAPFVIERVNLLREPFVFTWRRPGWEPWHWELTRVDQPELDLASSPF